MRAELREQLRAVAERAGARARDRGQRGGARGLRPPTRRSSSSRWTSPPCARSPSCTRRRTRTHDIPDEWLLDVERRRAAPRARAGRRLGAPRGRATGERGRRARRGGPRRPRARSSPSLSDIVEALKAARERVDRIGDAQDDVRDVPVQGAGLVRGRRRAVFFGREQLVAQLVARLVGAPMHGCHGPVGQREVVGVSGGPAARAGRGVLPGSDRWGRSFFAPASTRRGPSRDCGLSAGALGHSRGPVRGDVHRLP